MDFFEKAKLAKEKSEESQVKENNILGEYYNTINGEIFGNRDDYYTTTAYMPAYMNDRQKTVINLSNANDSFYVGFKATVTKLTVTQVTGTCGIVAVYGIKL